MEEEEVNRGDMTCRGRSKERGHDMQGGDMTCRVSGSHAGLGFRVYARAMV
jgi:hypothetical protein